MEVRVRQSSGKIFQLPIWLIQPSKLFKSQIERKIDEAVEKIYELQTKRNGGLRKVCEPLNEWELWKLVKNHLEIYSTTAKLKDQFSLQMGMKCNIETLIATNPNQSLT
jgi:hypothetical protein